jgi:hypothetical protein
VAPDFSELASCADLSAERAIDAASSPSAMRKLLARATQIAKPDDGCPKILLAVARLAEMDWIEGDLRVELAGDDETTTLSIMSDHGFGVRERILPAVRLAAPLDEFVRAVQLAPKLVAPLQVQARQGRLVLVQRDELEEERPSIRIHQASLTDRPDPPERSSPPPPFDDGDVHEMKTSPPPAGAVLRSESVVERLDSLEHPSSVPLDRAANGDDTPVPGSASAAANIHTRPTTRMQVIDPEVIRAATGKRDPRREDE